MHPINWHDMLVPSSSLLELVIRTSVMYLLILAGFRIFRRDAGSLSVADLLVVVIIADAAQNGLADDYKSLTEGVVVVVTIFFWDFALDWLAFQFPKVHALLHPPAVLLVRNGRIQHHNLDAQLLTPGDLIQQLREQGVDKVSSVKQACLESDGRISIVQRDASQARAKGNS